MSETDIQRHDLTAMRDAIVAQMAEAFKGTHTRLDDVIDRLNIQNGRVGKLEQTQSAHSDKIASVGSLVAGMVQKRQVKEVYAGLTGDAADVARRGVTWLHVLIFAAGFGLAIGAMNLLGLLRVQP